MAMKVLARDENGRIMKFSIIRPDNWHGHARRKKQMEAIIATLARVYGRMTVMPNTGPMPILTVAEALIYRQEIVDALIARGFSRERAERFPRMTVYLHQGTTVEDVQLAKQYDMDFKFYPKNPKHGTTGSQYGVPSLRDVDEQIAAMAEYGVRLLVHGESAIHSQILDLERHFVDEEAVGVISKHPTLLLVFEHLTTEEAVQFVCSAPDNVTATITPQHSWYSINSLFEGGLRPFRYCLPLYKHPKDMEALIWAATSGNRKFCAGDDTASHPERGPRGAAKLADCGCAGAYVAPVSMPMYITAFEKAGALDRLEDFTSVNGALTRGLPLNEDEVVFERKDWVVKKRYGYGNNDSVVPLCAGETLEWQVVQS